jgi:hypothetical protein
MYGRVFLGVGMAAETSSAPRGRWDGGGCPAGGFGRRSFLQGAAATGIAATVSEKHGTLRDPGGPAYAGESANSRPRVPRERPPASPTLFKSLSTTLDEERG